MLGFIVELHMCPHIPSCERNALLPTVGKECVHVYFFGSVASWPPVLSVVIGQCVTITGLQRKLILVGPEKNEHFLFVAKKSSLVSQLSPSGCVPMDCGGKEPCFRAREKDPSTSRVTRANIHKELPCDSKEGARIGSYIEIVTDIPMPGQLVELNKQAWLLLTHYNVSQLHGLCVGAMCCSNLQEIIMEHLPFASAFWVLQVIVSLRCKFQGVYTQKQLIGSQKDSSVCWHNTGMSSHPSDHTCDSAPILIYELRMCSRSFFGTIVFAAWEKIFHLDYQQREKTL
ncbi:hypothetical protein BDL97_08G042100 [Sphagnum fallax]|nr:hypothetical protein BDL97_08G042100 [Sphagnum fallax]